MLHAITKAHPWAEARNSNLQIAGFLSNPWAI
jgi:hypothetical protein